VASEVAAGGGCTLYAADNPADGNVLLHTECTDAVPRATCYVKTPSFSNETSCSSTTNPSFLQITKVVAYPVGASISLFWDPADAQSLRSFNAPALPPGGVSPKGALQCYLNSSVPDSYTVGRI
jgi:hypothetical protein